MTRGQSIVVMLLSIVVLCGCGKSSDEKTETARAAQQDDGRPDYLPPPRPENPMTQAVKDNMERLKKAHNITRDESFGEGAGVMANDFLEVWYPKGRMSITHGMRIFVDVTPARDKFEEFFGQSPSDILVVRVTAHMEQFKKWTQRDWWYYADIKADTMTYQPIYVMIQRGIVDMAIPHEYYQWALGKITGYGAPRWLEEGVASYLSDEGGLLARQLQEFPEESRVMSPARIEEVLVSEETREESRIAYYHSYRMVTSLVDAFGEASLKKVVSAMANGLSRDEAFQQAFGMSYEKTLETTEPPSGKI